MATNSWIFQANPNSYDIDNALKSLTKIDWIVTRYKDDIHIDDKVYLWKSGADAAIIAIATIITEPSITIMNEAEQPFIKDRRKFNLARLRVCLQIESVLDKPLYRKELSSIPVLQNMHILKAPQGTNFKLTAQESDVLNYLIGNICSGN